MMRTAQLGIDLADERVTEARTGYLPTLRVTETITRGNNPVFVFGSLLEQSRFGPQNFSLPALNNPEPVTNVRTAVSANLPVFDGLKTPARVAQASIARDQAVLQREAAEQRVRFDVLRQYLGVLVAQANTHVADGAVRMAESDLNRTKDRFDAGVAVESDRLAAQVQLAEFIKQQIESEGNLATAIVALNVAIGSPPQTQYTLAGALVKKDFIVLRQEELINRALLHRPDYLHATDSIEFAERQLSERRRDYLPELNLFGSFGASGRNWATGSTDYAVGAGVTINLLDPGRGSRISQAQIQQSLARSELDRMRDQIVVEVARAYHKYRAAVQQLEVTEAGLSQAEEALRIIQDRYEAGLTTISDLLRAETALVRARVNVITATEAQYISYASILLATGEFNDVHAFEL
jgi:outer membrane protein TolC